MIEIKDYLLCTFKSCHMIYDIVQQTVFRAKHKQFKILLFENFADISYNLHSLTLSCNLEVHFMSVV